MQAELKKNDSSTCISRMYILSLRDALIFPCVTKDLWFWKVGESTFFTPVCWGKNTMSVDSKNMDANSCGRNEDSKCTACNASRGLHIIHFSLVQLAFCFLMTETTQREKDRARVSEREKDRGRVREREKDRGRVLKGRGVTHLITLSLVLGGV